MTVLEIAEYALASNVSEKDFLSTRPAVEAWLEAQPGFQSLRLVRDGARWMDVCEWKDTASAQAAAQSFMQDPGVATFMAALDPASVVMRHLEVVA